MRDASSDAAGRCWMHLDDPRGAAVAAFVATWGLMAVAMLLVPRMRDGDAYFHLAVAQQYGRGLFDSLPWARFSVMHEGYGDKELLFHLYLLPFVSLLDPVVGGKLALSLLHAAIAGSLAYFGVSALGRTGLLVPLMVFFTSGAFLNRVTRLRPELIAVLLLLWVCWAAAADRRRWIGVLALIFTLAYTAFHALLILVGLLCAWELWSRRRFPWGWLAYATMGAGLGIVLHPQFPANVEVWIVQNVDFFRFKDRLDVGTEIAPHTTRTLALLDWPLCLSMLALWWARVPSAAPGRARRTADAFWMGALAFGGLTLSMGRFTVYLVPMAVAALAWELRARGYGVGPRMRLVGGREVSTRVALWVLVPVGMLWVGLNVATNMRVSAAFDRSRDEMMATWARHVPRGARVAAEWGPTEEYVFWAPWGRYLNVLDPVFMAVAHPRRHLAHRLVFDGAHPDTPLATVRDLDSDFLAFPPDQRPALQRRLRADPRVETVFDGDEALYRIAAGKNRRMVLDWRVVDGATPTEVRYPRAGSARLEAVEGLVDMARLQVGACVVLEHVFEVERERRVLFELAPLGPTILWLDGTERAQLAVPGEAVPGAGVGVAQRLTPGVHRVRVRTCRREDGRGGFYLIDRSP